MALELSPGHDHRAAEQIIHQVNADFATEDQDAHAGAIRCWRLDFDPVNQKPRREEWLNIAKAYKPTARVGCKVTQISWKFLAYAIAIFWAGTCAAADPIVTGSLRACAAITSDGERLACYDREMAKLVPAAAGAAAASPSATIAAPLSPEQRFGLSPAQADAKVSQTSESEPLPALEARVSAVRNITNGRILIDLDNGQVWRQVDTDVTFRLRSGDAVIIKRNSFGSYWLSANEHALRVKRVQ